MVYLMNATEKNNTFGRGGSAVDIAAFIAAMPELLAKERAHIERQLARFPGFAGETAFRRRLVEIDALEGAFA
jgi:hypothetical protein